MKAPQTNEVGQAVFGYSNGHRLLTSTSKLSAVDVYELAAASDLAPGARIVGDASYLTGLLLPESKLYALVRTWLAPEMPRPGCVWSHVLLLDHVGMATQVDLAVVADLHRRPADFATDPNFATPFKINQRLRAARADPLVTERVLLACYSDLSLDETNEKRVDLERAILSVWSQQWPRMRRQFTFRSVSTSADPRRQFLRMERGARPVAIQNRSQWLEQAVFDATSEAVSPLRRFLWRYGKDIPSRRSLLPELVSLYDATRSKRLEYATADRILARFPAGQADTLKSDMLGLSTGRSGLVPTIEAVDLVRLVAERPDLDVVYEEAFAFAVARGGSNVLARLPAMMTTLREELGDRFDRLFEAIVPMLDAASLEGDDAPAEFLLQAVTRRPELLSSAAMRRLTNEELRQLWPYDLSYEQRGEIIRVAMQRPVIDGFGSIVLSDPYRTLHDALDLHEMLKLHADWIALISSNALAFVGAVAQSASGADLVRAIQLLGFPLDKEEVVRPWFAAFQKYRSKQSQDDETRLFVYFLSLCLKHDYDRHRDILTEILEPLRKRIVRDEIPYDVRDILSIALPNDRDYWDLNKRLLKFFRKAAKDGRDPGPLLSSLNLTDEEYAYATNQDPDSIVRKYFEAFNPWKFF